MPALIASAGLILSRFRGVFHSRRGKYDFRRADAVLKALNVTSGRHVVANSAATASAGAETAPGLVASPTVQPESSTPAPISPQPVGERPANGHAGVIGTATCQNGDEHAGSAQQQSARGDEDDGAAMGAATKRLKLDAGTSGVELQAHSAKAARAVLLLRPSPQVACQHQAHRWLDCVLCAGCTGMNGHAVMSMQAAEPPNQHCIRDGSVAHDQQPAKLFDIRVSSVSKQSLRPALRGRARCWLTGRMMRTIARASPLQNVAAERHDR